MAAVKTVLVVITLATTLACTEEAAGARELAPADCGLIPRPGPARIIEVDITGELRAGEPCQTMACIAGARGVSARRFDASISLSVGSEQRLVPVVERSLLRPSAKLHGVAVGPDIALIDHGDQWEVWQPPLPSRFVPPVPLLPRERVIVVWHGRGTGVVLVVANDGASRVMSLIEGVHPGLRGDGRFVNSAATVWLVDDRLERADGTSLALGTVDPRMSVTVEGNVVTAAEERSTKVWVDDLGPAVLPPHTTVLRMPGGALAIQHSGDVHRVVPADGALSVEWQAGGIDRDRHNGRAVRATVATHGSGISLISERVALERCAVIDRVWRYDPEDGGLRLLTTDDDGVIRGTVKIWRDGFAFVEAPVNYEAPDR